MLPKTKKFLFFSCRPVPLPALDISGAIIAGSTVDTNHPHLHGELSPSCSTSGHGLIIIGENNGRVQIFGKGFQQGCFFSAFSERVDRVHHVRLGHLNVLITIGAEDDSSPCSLKVFDIGMQPYANVSGLIDARLLTTIRLPIDPHTRVFSSSLKTLKTKTPIPSSSPSASASASIETLPLALAIGLDNGKVLLFDHLDLKKEKEPRVLLSDNQYPITGVFFNEKGETGNIFVTTTHSILSLSFSGRDVITETLDGEKGCNLHCSSLLSYTRTFRSFEHHHEFLTASIKQTFRTGLSDSNFFIENFTPETRAESFPSDGEKQKLFCFNNHIVTIKKTAIPSEIELEIFDHTNKHIAFGSRFQPISEIVSEWGNLYIFTRRLAGKPLALFELQELDIDAKLQLLNNTKNYSEAVKLVQINYDKHLERTVKLYADDLFRKKLYEDAISCYVMTIGSLEPSYVVQKYSDPKNINNLTLYLEELAKRGFSKPLYSTMLMYCYITLKTPEKILEMISEKRESETDFDAENVIKTCCQAVKSNRDFLLMRKFTFVALALAKYARSHEIFLEILIEDKPARDLLGILFHKDCAEIIAKYSPHFSSHNPSFLNMIKEIKTSPHKFPNYLLNPIMIPIISCPLPVCELTEDSHLDQSSYVLLEPETVQSLDLANFHAAIDALQEFKRIDLFKAHGAKILEADPQAMIQCLERSVGSQPDEFFDIFIQQNDLLQQFIETLIQSKGLQKDIYSLKLLQLRLEKLSALQKESSSSLSASHNESCESLKEDIHKFVQSSKFFEDYEALALLEQSGIQQDSHIIFENLGRESEAIRSLVATRQTNTLIDYCLTHNVTERSTWVGVLRLLAAENNPRLLQVVQFLEERNILPLMVIIELLSNTKDTCFGVIKEHVLNELRKNKDLITREEEKIKTIATEEDQLLQDIHDLNFKPILFSNRLCSACKSDLDFPSLHFCCGHSFHQSCLGEPPVCRFCNFEIEATEEPKNVSLDDFYNMIGTKGDKIDTIMQMLVGNRPLPDHYHDSPTFFKNRGITVEQPPPPPPDLTRSNSNSANSTTSTSSSSSSSSSSSRK